MGEFEIHDLAVCIVCLHVIANGEFDDGTDGYGVWNKRCGEWESLPAINNDAWSEEEAKAALYDRAKIWRDDTLEVRPYGSALASTIGQHKIWGENTRHLVPGRDCDEECHYHDDPDDCELLDLGFSHNDCEGCGDVTFGDRFRAHALIPVGC